MKILFLTRLFYPHIGGVEKHVSEVSKVLIEKGHRVIVITEKHAETLKDRERIEDIEVYRIPVGKNEWSFGKLRINFKKFEIWLWLFRNRELIQNADIVHAHDVFFWYFPFLFLYPRKKVFVTFHGYESYPLKSKDIIMHKVSEKLSMGNICIGDFIQKWYGTKPTYVTYGAVGIFNFQFSIFNKTRKKSAVFVGRLDEQTGFLTYLEAVKKIREKFPDFKLTVFGDGKFKKKIEGEIEFKGFVNNAQEEIGKYGIVFASRYLSILEAMAAKKPVIAVYDSPIKEDYLKMSPFAKYIIVVNSAQEVAGKVISLLNDPDESRVMIDKSFKWAKNQTWENLGALYLRLWNKISN